MFLLFNKIMNQDLIMRNILLKTFYFMLFMSQLCHSEVVQKDSLEIQIYNRQIKRDSNIFFQFCCYKDKKIKVTDTGKNADLLPGESFVQTLFVTPGTSFYFQGDNVIEGKSFQQLQYTCGPQDENSCQVQLMGSAMRNLSSL